MTFVGPLEYSVISGSVTNATEDLAIHIHDFTIEQASTQLKATTKVISKGKISYDMDLWKQKFHIGHQY